MAKKTTKFAPPMLLKKSAVKEVIKNHLGLNCSGEIYEKLNKEVFTLLKKASSRCQQNKRGTVKARDV